CSANAVQNVIHGTFETTASRRPLARSASSSGGADAGLSAGAALTQRMLAARKRSAQRGAAERRRAGPRAPAGRSASQRASEARSEAQPSGDAQARGRPRAGQRRLDAVLAWYSSISFFWISPGTGEYLANSSVNS